MKIKFKEYFYILKQKILLKKEVVNIYKECKVKIHYFEIMNNNKGEGKEW